LSKGETLESWKEISGYLNRNARTCQRWEVEFGLPVHRLDGSPKARVYAYTAELDKWLDEKLHETEAHEALIRRILARRRLRIAAAAVGLAALGILGWYLYHHRKPPAGPGPSPKPSLAIVYFTNNSGDEDLGYLSESLPADLILGIQRTGARITVVSIGRILEVARQLGLKAAQRLSSADIKNIVDRTAASHVLLGYISKTGDHLRIDCELRNAADLRNILTCQVTGRPAELSGMEGRLLDRILAAFDLAPSGAHGPQPLCSPKANQFYLAGRNAEWRYLEQKKDDDLALAVGMLKKAESEDPGCALPYLGLGDAYRLQYLYAEKTSGNLDLMTENYEKAFKINPGLAETNIGLGWNRFLRQDDDQAYQYFKRAREIDPDNLGVNYEIGSFLLSVGEFDKAAGYFSRVIESASVSSRVYSFRAFCYEWMGNYDAALKDTEKIVELEPTDYRPRCHRARILILMKKLNEAETDIDIAGFLAPGHCEVHLTKALLWAARGDRDKALAALASAAGNVIPRTYIESRVYASLGYPDKALAAITLAIDTAFREFHYYAYSYLYLKNTSDYFYDSLRGDPRFLEILKRQERRFNEQTAHFAGL
jgi:tetratricopeptide (TPR) repeat protein